MKWQMIPKATKCLSTNKKTGNIWKVCLYDLQLQLDIFCSVSPPYMWLQSFAQLWGSAPPCCHAIILSARLQGAVISQTAGGILSVSQGGVCGPSLWFHSPVGCHFSNICLPADSFLSFFLSVYPHSQFFTQKDFFYMMGSKFYLFNTKLNIYLLFMQFVLWCVYWMWCRIHICTSKLHN